LSHPDGEHVGDLIQDDGGQMIFRYGVSWRDDPESLALPRSLPLREEPFRQRECRGFFGGILPEQDNRKIIARILGISDENDFSMLEQIGGECAGAIFSCRKIRRSQKNTPLPKKMANVTANSQKMNSAFFSIYRY